MSEFFVVVVAAAAAVSTQAHSNLVHRASVGAQGMLFFLHCSRHALLAGFARLAKCILCERVAT